MLIEYCAKLCRDFSTPSLDTERKIRLNSSLWCLYTFNHAYILEKKRHFQLKQSLEKFPQQDIPPHATKMDATNSFSKIIFQEGYRRLHTKQGGLYLVTAGLECLACCRWRRRRQCRAQCKKTLKQGRQNRSSRLASLASSWHLGLKPYDMEG
ncbi:uncharacterized protein LOC131052722 isoform X2 [Cryptomeria japonica]|uniref:uncharacterized protein LOC131052722 isoform X2 n=1 Tax=Cryptomeria japonica TaxID=3369 RepID=UPI0027DAB20D|nr:uncharacterized protein LOC131052722 isoform X2 [Cryptomeria japonica]